MTTEHTLPSYRGDDDRFAYAYAVHALIADMSEELREEYLHDLGWRNAPSLELLLNGHYSDEQLRNMLVALRETLQGASESALESDENTHATDASGFLDLKKFAGGHQLTEDSTHEIDGGAFFHAGRVLCPIFSVNVRHSETGRLRVIPVMAPSMTAALAKVVTYFDDDEYIDGSDDLDHFE